MATSVALKAVVTPSLMPPSTMATMALKATTTTAIIAVSSMADTAVAIKPMMHMALEKRTRLPMVDPSTVQANTVAMRARKTDRREKQERKEIVSAFMAKTRPTMLMALDRTTLMPPDQLITVGENENLLWLCYSFPFLYLCTKKESI